MPSPVALLDANVLISAGIRDVILEAAWAKRCDIRWSADILAEIERHLPDFIHIAGDDAEGAQETKRRKAAEAVSAMQRAFPTALVTNYQRHIAKMTNAPTDRHVTAAAFEAKVDMIVTFNLRDFSPRALSPVGLRATNPDTFLMQLARDDPVAMADVIHTIEQRLRRPSRTAEQILDGLVPIVPQFAQSMRVHLRR